MSAFLAVLMTVLELSLTAFAFFTHNQALFADMVMYGSPFYLLMTAFNPGSPFTDGPKIYLAFFVYHIIKYITIIRARLIEEHPGMALCAIIFEAIYLALSAYYLN